MTAGLFGFNPEYHGIDPSCAKDCKCSIKHAVKISHQGSKLKYLPDYSKSTLFEREWVDMMGP